LSRPVGAARGGKADGKGDDVVDVTVGKGLYVLEYLARAEGLVRLSDVARDLRLHKSNAHRLLNSLVELGYAHRDPETGRYLASLKLWELGTLVLDRSALKRAVDPVIGELQRSTSETTSLVVLMGDDVLYLAQVVSSMPIRPSTRVGRRVPAIFPASGKALLAHHPEAEQIAKRLIASHPKAKGMKLSAVLGELAVIRERGYAISVGGWTKGIHSVASVVWARGGQPAAAIAISGPAERLDEDRMKALGQEVLNACTRMGEVGYL
jgi:IclR family KDG regulon transcriptional repressor